MGRGVTWLIREQEARREVLISDERKTPVRHVKAGEYSTLLQGGEYGRGWSFVIQHDTGKMSAAIAGDEGAVVLLGARCVH